MPRLSKHDMLLKQNRALALRLSGASLQAVADAMGYRSASSAHHVVTKALEDQRRERGGQILDMELERLDRLQRAIWQQALRGDLKAVDTALRIFDHRAKLTKLFDQQPTGDHDAIKAAFAGLLEAAIAHPLAAVEPPGGLEHAGHASASPDGLPAPETGAQPLPEAPGGGRSHG